MKNSIRTTAILVIVLLKIVTKPLAAQQPTGRRGRREVAAGEHGARAHRDPCDLAADGPRRLGPGRSGTGGRGRLEHPAGDLEVVGHRRPECLEVSLARQPSIERLEPPGRAHEQSA